MDFRTQAVVWIVSLLLLTIAVRHIIGEIIIVAKNGENNATCLPSEEPAQHPCYTLDYVLQNLPNLSQTSGNNLTVKVNYSHELKRSVDTTNVENLTLTISGVRVPIVIDCAQGSGIRIVSMSAITLTWEWLTFQGCNLSFYATSSGFSVSMISCHITNCKTVHLFNVEEAMLDGCLFSNNTIQSTQILQIDVESQNVPKFHYHINSTRFEGNTADNNISIMAFRISRSVPVLLTILFDNCTLRNNLQITSNSGLVDVFIIQNSIVPQLNVSFLDCFFVENNLSSLINLELSNGSDIHQGNIEIISNTFTHNNIVSCTSPSCSIVLVNSNQMDDSDLQFHYSNNIFDHNNGTVLIANGKHSNHTIHGCKFTNNLVDSTLIDVSCTAPKACNFWFKDVTVTGNYLNNFDPKSLQALINVNYTNITVTNGNFSHNQGSVLNLNKTTIFFAGNVIFSHNIAIYGGAIRASHSNVSSRGTDSTSGSVTFSHNTARYGGAVYSLIDCFFVDCDTAVVFENNSAGLGDFVGSSIYSVENHCICTCPVYKERGVSSPPMKIAFSNLTSSHIPTAPGQEVVVEVEVTDCSGSPSACTADVYLLCNDNQLLCQDMAGNTIQLVGPPEVFLISGTVNTGLHIEQSNATIEQLSPELFFQCQEGGTSTSLPLEIVDCPSGFWFNKNKYSMYKCQCPASLPNFKCSETTLQACIQIGYWYGIVDDIPMVAACQYPFCSYSSSKECPSELSSGTLGYLLLGNKSSEQCSFQHDGILCTGCSINTVPSFGALQCIEEAKCQAWHPYVLLSFSILVEVLFCVFIFVAIRLKLDVGLGYMYGPLFFMAVVSRLPIDDHTVLVKIISMFTSVFLQNLEVLGQIPWCFFVLGNSNETIYALPYYSFRFLGPFVIAVVLLLVTFMARRCAQMVNFIQQSPMEPFCVLIMLSSWSLADTSVKILMYVSFDTGTKVALQPNLTYLHGVHIPLWILSILFLVFFFIPLIFFLLFSPFLTQYRWVHQSQPFLDQFQSCYRNKFRWYAVVYFGSWLILQVVHDMMLFQALVIFIATCHFLLQPYKKHWLNIADSLLLSDLVFVTVLHVEKNSPYIIDTTDGHSIGREITMYLLVCFPFLYIMIGSIVIIAAKNPVARFVQKIFLSIYVRLQKHVMKYRIAGPDQQVEDSEDATGREPLIGIIQNDTP